LIPVGNLVLYCTFRVFFDEPQIHISTETVKGDFAAAPLFEIGNVIAHVEITKKDDVELILSGADRYTIKR
jgi:hypothetical protein